MQYCNYNCVYVSYIPISKLSNKQIVRSRVAANCSDITINLISVVALNSHFTNRACPYNLKTDCQQNPNRICHFINI